ncbi:unnamed protein product [Dicrocoelium dendriticum]|nr:unnamed protein product [Dicrocoelium dendriticum]
MERNRTQMNINSAENLGHYERVDAKTNIGVPLDMNETEQELDSHAEKVASEGTHWLGYCGTLPLIPLASRRRSSSKISGAMKEKFFALRMGDIYKMHEERKTKVFLEHAPHLEHCQEALTRKAEMLECSSDLDLNRNRRTEAGIALLQICYCRVQLGNYNSATEVGFEALKRLIRLNNIAEYKEQLNSCVKSCDRCLAFCESHGPFRCLLAAVLLCFMYRHNLLPEDKATLFQVLSSDLFQAALFTSLATAVNADRYTDPTFPLFDSPHLGTVLSKTLTVFGANEVMVCLVDIIEFSLENRLYQSVSFN